MVAPPAVLPNLTQLFFHISVIKYVTVASLALLAYDYCITFWEEVEFVWSSRWTIPKVLFMVNRYLAFVDPILLVYVLCFGTTPKSCVHIFRILGYCSTSGFIMAQGILVMRTIAIWERKHLVVIPLMVMLTAAVVLDIYLTNKYLQGIGSVPGPIGYRGCLLTYDSRIIFLNFFLVMTTETAMLALLVVKALKHFRNGRSTLMVTMYQDGIFHFCFILATSIANAVTLRVAPIEMNNFLIVLQRVLHSMLCNRVVLHIRGASRGNEDEDFVHVSGQSHVLPIQAVPLSPISPISQTRHYHAYPPQKRDAFAKARVNW